MTSHQAFRRQAESDLAVSQLLLARDRHEVPGCHPLHYVQMAAEKAAKAVIFALGQEPPFRHNEFSKLRKHLERKDVARVLGYAADKWEAYRSYLRSIAPVCLEVDQLNPSVGTAPTGSTHGPNVEYPWPSQRDPEEWIAPCTWPFSLAQDGGPGHRDLLKAVTFIRLLLSRVNQIAELRAS